MIGYYLPENTKYLTSQGMLCVSDFNEDTYLAEITDGKIVYTKNFNISKSFLSKSLTLQTDGKYQSIISDRVIDFISYTDLYSDKEDSTVKISLDEDIIENLNKSDIIALCLYISNNFQIEDDIIIGTGKEAFDVLSSVNYYIDVYFNYDTLSKQYSFKSPSLYKGQDELVRILLDNFDIFKKVVTKLKDFKCSIESNNYDIMYFKTYRLANTFSTLLSLSNYKSRVVFDNNKSMFKVIYTNNIDLLNYEYNITSSIVKFKKPKQLFKVIPEDECSIVVSQSIKKISTSSILSISYNKLGDDIDA